MLSMRGAHRRIRNRFKRVRSDAYEMRHELIIFALLPQLSPSSLFRSPFSSSLSFLCDVRRTNDAVRYVAIFEIFEITLKRKSKRDDINEK